MLAASTVRSTSTPHLSSRLHNAVRRAHVVCGWFQSNTCCDLLRVVANTKESQRTGITQLSFFGQALRSGPLAASRKMATAAVLAAILRDAAQGRGSSG